MRMIFLGLQSVVMLLMLAICHPSVEAYVSQPTPDKPSGLSQLEIPPSSAEPEPSETGENSMTNINITIGRTVFSAKLHDNEAARTLMAQFPITIDMSELNGNEKYYYLADDLPSDATEKPEVMQAGDIMCWSGNCLVLFYETFPNSYGGYVRLGYVEDASGLSTTLGQGNVTVMFTVDE